MGLISRLNVLAGLLFRVCHPFDKHDFARHVVSLTDSGMAITQALQCLSACFTNQQQAYYQELSQLVAQGLLLSQALQRIDGNLTPYEYHLIVLGEQTQQLSACLRLLADYYTRQHKVKRQLLAMGFMPCFNFIMAIVVTYGIGTFVLPEIASLYPKDQLPPLTKHLMTSIDVVNTYGGVILVITLAIIVILKFVLTYTHKGDSESESGDGSDGERLLQLNLIKQNIIDTIPGYSAISTSYRYSQICQMLAMALAQNMHLLDAFALVAASQTHIKTRRVFHQLQQAILVGHPVHSALVLTEGLPRIFSEIAMLGAQQSKLDESFTQLSHFFTEQLIWQCERGQRWLQPVLLLMIALIIGIMIVALYAPLLRLGVIL